MNYSIGEIVYYKDKKCVIENIMPHGRSTLVALVEYGSFEWDFFDGRYIGRCYPSELSRTPTKEYKKNKFLSNCKN